MMEVITTKLLLSIYRRAELLEDEIETVIEENESHLDGYAMSCDFTQVAQGDEQVEEDLPDESEEHASVDLDHNQRSAIVQQQCLGVNSIPDVFSAAATVGIPIVAKRKVTGKRKRGKSLGSSSRQCKLCMLKGCKGNNGRECLKFPHAKPLPKEKTCKGCGSNCCVGRHKGISYCENST